MRWGAGKIGGSREAGENAQSGGATPPGQDTLAETNMR